MSTYKIANIVFAINFAINDAWCQFSTDAEQCDFEVVKENPFYSEYQIYGYKLFPWNCERVFLYDTYTIVVDKEWEKVSLISSTIREKVSSLLIMIFNTHAVQRHMIQIHSSMIEYSGNGLLFLGPSGIGKTTMAELWNKYRGALIINGDMNFVQETDECFLGWGTPWHGSSPYCENTSVPVKALIVLKQAPENSIRELKDFEKVQLVSNNIIYPTWLENGMELCLETLNHLLSAVPVYELSCRPDEEAVRLTEEAVFGGRA